MKYHVELQLEENPEMTVREAHDIATEVRFAIKDALPWVADVLVHVEPASSAGKFSREPAAIGEFDGK